VCRGSWRWDDRADGLVFLLLDEVRVGVGEVRLRLRIVSTTARSEDYGSRRVG
jgi:hypothetical protein